MFRVALASLRVILPILPRPKLKSLLKVYYKVSGRYPVIDSNALVIIWACRYLEKTGDQDFLNRHKKQLLRALSYYKTRTSAQGLIVQHPFSDWQDCAKREGEIFLTQLHFWKAASLLEEIL